DQQRLDLRVAGKVVGRLDGDLRPNAVGIAERDGDAHHRWERATPVAHLLMVFRTAGLWPASCFMSAQDVRVPEDMSATGVARSQQRSPFKTGSPPACRSGGCRTPRCAG